MDLRQYCRSLMLLGSIRAALMNGVRHHDPDGKLLETEGAILDALAVGPVTLDESGRIERTTDGEQTLLAFRELHRQAVRVN